MTGRPSKFCGNFWYHPEQIKEEGKVTITGFATFTSKHKEASTGRNPRTGETVTIPARNAVVIKAGSKLKDALN